MKLRAIIFLAVCAPLFTWAQANEHVKPHSPYKISGMVNLMAYPGCDSLHANSSIPTYGPAKGLKLYIMQDMCCGVNDVILDSVITDSTGHFSIEFNGGYLRIAEPWKTQDLVMPMDSPDAICDTACYRKQYEKADYATYVNSSRKVTVFIYHYGPNSNPCCTPVPSVNQAQPEPPKNRTGNQPGHQE